MITILVKAPITQLNHPRINEILRDQDFVGVLPSIAKFKGERNELYVKN